MERALLEEILDRAPGFESGDEGFEIAEKHRAALHIGRGRQTLVLAELKRVRVDERLIEVEDREGTLHFYPLDDVVGLTVRPPQEERPRTGF